MLRNLALIAAAFASAGVAHAQDRIIVTTTGKSPRIVKAELFRAAYTVCANTLDPLESQTLGDCTRDSFDNALQRFHDLQRSQSTPSARIASR